MKTPAKILIVEDEKIVALDIKNQLAQMGFPSPLIASTGEEAVRIAEEQSPDVVLMDISLSEGVIDGITAASKITSRADIPIIYVTAQADEGTIQRVKNTEMYGYILKPIYYRELEIAIEFALHKHQTAKMLKEQRKWLSTTIKGIGDAIITTDHQERVVIMNPAAERITGWSEEEAHGRNFSDIFQTIERIIPDSGAAFVWSYGQSPAKGGQTMLISRSGGERPIQCTIWELKSEDGEKMGKVFVVKDMSGAERMEWSISPEPL
jgi:PAS domain S-box-containing protein